MQNDALTAVLDELETMFAPLLDAGENPDRLFALLRRTGWTLADSLPDIGVLAAALSDLRAAIDAIRGIAEGGSPDFTAFETALRSAADVPRALERLSTTVAGIAPSTAAQAVAQIPADLLEVLLLDWIALRAPLVDALFRATGLIEAQRAVRVEGSQSRTLREPVFVDRLQLQALSEWIAHPAEEASRRFGMASVVDDATAGAYALRVFPLLALLAQAMGGRAMLGRGPGALRRLAAEDELAIAQMLKLEWALPEVAAGPASGTGVLGAILAVAGPEGSHPAGLSVAPFGGTSFTVAASGWAGTIDLQAATEALVFRAGGTELPSTAGSRFEGHLSLGRSGAPLRLGSATGTRFEIGAVQLTGSMALTPTSRAFGFELEVAQAGLIFAAGDGDGFLSNILPPEAIATRFDFGLSWSNTAGFSFHGNAGLNARFDIHRTLAGIIDIETVWLGISAKSDGGAPALAAEASLTGGVKIGPIAATIERMGLRVQASFPPGGGNVGPAQLGIGFKPPNGVGLSIDAGPVKGGGYLFFDPDQALYAGAVQLSMKALAFNAVGVVTTRLPDGGDGFSMLLIITAEFPPIQLGFGFTLNGLGGLAGIHRAMDQDALSACLREGRLDSILFPRDVVANVRRIVDDIRTVFPPQRDRHVFGPMVKIGWGANALLEMDVAVLISLPSPIVIAILGRMRAALPTKDNAVVDLRLEVLGLIDLGRGRITVEARLVDSRIAAFAVTGGMALLISWGATKAFVLSVGGFHPRFLPPPDFHAPARLAIALSSGDNPTFALSSYFAITSNAVQFGAGADFRLAADTALGLFELLAYARFDVLLVFDPPFFAADLVAGIEVKRNGATLFLAKLEASLTGPEPWRIAGLVEIQIVVPVRIPFQHTLGGATTQTPAAMRPLDELRRQLAAEIARAENWAALPTADADAVVVLRKVEAVPGTVLVHPLGGLGFRQRTLPLGKVLRKFGTATVSDPGAFAITGLALGGAAVASRGVDDDFAPGEFESLSDDEKLARPAFETLPAGVEATPAGPWLPRSLRAPVTPGFEETVVAPNGNTTGGTSTQPGLGFVQPDPRRFGDAGAAAIRVRPERWVLADPDTLQTPPGGEAAHAVLADAQRGRADARVRVPAHDAIVVVDP